MGILSDVLVCIALQGDILLVDLKLRPDSLSVLELPLEVLSTLLYCVALYSALEVVRGSIGKLSIKIPWTSLACR